jgi:hypothetical protein
MEYVNERPMMPSSYSRREYGNVLKHMQNHTENLVERSKAFRGQANHAIYSNLFLETAVLLGAQIVIGGGKASCTNLNAVFVVARAYRQ